MHPTTKKKIKQIKWAVIGFGYCQIQNLTRYLEATSYTFGKYGWNQDTYNVDGYSYIALSTGYRPIDFGFNKEFNSFIKEEVLALDKKAESFKGNIQEGRKLFAQYLSNIVEQAFENYEGVKK